MPLVDDQKVVQLLQRVATDPGWMYTWLIDLDRESGPAEEGIEVVALILNETGQELSRKTLSLLNPEILKFTATSSKTSIQLDIRGVNGSTELISLVFNAISFTPGPYDYGRLAYRFGFNGKENDREWGSGGLVQDFGARLYNPALGRWMARDPLEHKYPGLNPYNFVANTPLNAIDPDGRLIILINGLRMNGMSPRLDQLRDSPDYGIFNYDHFGYWSGKNHAGANTDLAQMFMDRIGDQNVAFTSGSSDFQSQASQRFVEGEFKADLFHKQVQDGKIKLADDETIKIVGHSQGGAHAAGMAKQLTKLGYKVEVIYYIAPHQPTGFIHPDGIRGVQYSHHNDAVSSRPWNEPPWVDLEGKPMNGGSKMGKILRVREFLDYDIPGLNKRMAWNPKWKAHRGGHDALDHYYIFDKYKLGDPGFVMPRQDVTRTQDDDWLPATRPMSTGVARPRNESLEPRNPDN